MQSGNAMCKQNEQIRQDWLDGMSYKAIADKYQIDQRTAKRYVQGNLPLEDLEHRPYTSILDDFEPLIRAALHEHPVSAKAIYRMLRAEGFQGGYTIVVRRVGQIIEENELNGKYPQTTSRTRTRTLPTKETLLHRIREEERHAASRTRKRKQ